MITVGDLNSLSTLSQGDWQQANILEKSANTVGAAVVDVGVTMWNSVANLATLGNYDDVSTRNVLQTIGADGAVSAYDNNRDTVDLLSFVGGVFIPGGAAVKLSRGIRAGLKSTSFLSPVRHKDDLLKFEKLIDTAQTGTAEYKSVKRGMYLRGQAENLMDNVAAEVAIMGTFNAHPYMDDYFEDPLKNFGISIAVGGVLGGAIGGLINRAEINNSVGKVETAAVDYVNKQTRLTATPFSDTSSALVQLDLAAKNLDNIANKETASPLAKNFAQSQAASMRATMGQIREGNVSDAILKGVTDQGQRDEILQRLNDVRFLGTEKLDFYSPTNVKQKPTSIFQKFEEALFKTSSIDMETGKTVETFNKSSYFNPELGSFLDKASADLAASAADITTKEGVVKRAKAFSNKQITSDFVEKAAIAKGGEVEADYLARLHYYNGKTTKQLTETELLADDLPAINGWIGAVTDRRKALMDSIDNGDIGDKAVTKALDELTELDTAKIKVFQSDRVRLVNLEEVSKLPENVIDPSEYVKPTFFSDLENEIQAGAIKPIMNDTLRFENAQSMSLHFYDVIKKETGITNTADLFRKLGPAKLEEYARKYANTPANAKSLLGFVSDGAQMDPSSIFTLVRWIGGAQGDKELFRNAMASARTLRAGMDSLTPFHDELTQVLNSPLVQAQRDILKKHGDANGNVYMLRGTKSAPTGDTTVSSYTHNEQIAKGFASSGTLGTYKISADDVVGYLYNGEREWLVGSSTRDFAQGSDLKSTVAALNSNRSTAGFAGFNSPQYNHHNLSSLIDFNTSSKIDAIGKELGAGKLREEVALKYNVSNEALDIIGSGSNLNLLDKALMLKESTGKDFNNLFNRWNSATQIDAAMAPTRKTLKVTSDPNKIMGDTGAILDRQRQAILGATYLSSTEKQLLNSMTTEGSEKIASKLSIIDGEYAEINQAWMENAVLTSKSKLARRLFDRLINTDDVSALKEGIKEFVNGKGGNPLYSSADFVTSRMGDVGKLVTALGEKRVHTVNTMFEELMTPVSTQLKTVANDPVMRTEFAIFDNLRQSTAGVLRFDRESMQFVTGSADTVWNRELGSFTQNVTAPDGTVAVVKVKGLPAFPEQVVKNQAVADAFHALQEAGDEVWNMQNSVNKVKGVQAPSDVGFWVPSNNLVNSNRAFILNKDDSSLRLLVGKSEEDLKTLMASIKLEANQSILTPAQVDQMKLSTHGDLLDDVTKADTSQLKKGIGLATPDISSDRLADIVNGFKDRLNYQATSFMENGMYDLTQKLDYLSNFNTTLSAKQSQVGFMSAVKQLQTKDTAKDIKAILTGNSNTNTQEFTGYINKFASASIQFGINGVQKAFSIVKPAFNGSTIDYDKYTAALKAQGIDDPFQVFNDAAKPLLYERARNSGYSVTPDRIINGGNSIAAAMALKIGELAQPLVNMMSLPILQISTISRSFKAANINGASDLLSQGPLSVMMGGMRRATSQLPENTKFLKYFEEEGLLAPTISEIDDVVKQSRFGTGGVVGGIEKALDSKFVEIMSKPSEIAEGLVRKHTLMTGVELAKRIYGPNASDKQVTIFARDFMKQSLGNYTTSQRPMMFQGTFGSAMGLFQTYMLTYAQNMYRHLDLKDYKGLGKTMLAQGGIFGAGSVPGFAPISEVIGENFSDENMDLQRGLYRGLPDPIANVIVYGLPSNLIGALHTRGDVTPRIPTGVTTLVAPSMIGQILGSMVDVGKSIGQADVNSGQAFMEALSAQSVSRPIARLSELASGYAVTRQGNQIAGQEEVWSWQGILARTFATRTLKEAKVREAIHINSVYAASNKANRDAVLGKLRTAIRGDGVTDDLMDNLANEYLRTGSPQGFRQAVNQAFMENSNEKLVDLHGKLGNSPLMLMLDDLD